MARIRISQGSGEWQPLPEGTYDFKITEVEQAVNKKGNAQLKLKLECASPSHSGKTATVFYSLLPQALWRLYELVDALDIERTDTGEVDKEGNPIYEIDDDLLPGCYVRYVVTQREYEGKKQNDFSKPALSPLDPYAAQQKASAPAATPAPAQPAAQPAPAAEQPVDVQAGAVRRRGRAA
jgi:hypothetical protein